MSREKITIVFKLDTLDIEVALGGIQAILDRHQVPSAGFKLDGHSTIFCQIGPRLKKANQNHFNLVGQGFEFDLSRVRNSKLNFLDINSSKGPNISWEEWAGQFIASPNFVMAWLANTEYQYWQNAFDPLQYTALGREYKHLPMKSNGLPYPLEKTIIDTSANPGRRELREGYIEVVGAVMWLGNTFWRLTGSDVKSLTGAPWVKVSHPTPSVVRIQAADSCFYTAEGSSGDIQRKLRSLLFP